MTEVNSSKVTLPSVDTGTPSTVQISDKTPNTWLKEHQKEWATNDVRDKLTDDIITNARELTSEVDWGEILKNTTWVAKEGNYIGRPAVAISVARVIGTVAREMGWNMDSPQVVYMSGSVFVNFLGRRLAYLGDSIKAIEEGKVNFPTEEITQGKLAERKTENARLGTFSHRLTEAMESYIENNQPEATDPKYREILHRLPFTGHQSMLQARNKALIAFKNGKLEQAVSELNSPPKKGRGISPFS